MSAENGLNIENSLAETGANVGANMIVGAGDEHSGDELATPTSTVASINVPSDFNMAEFVGVNDTNIRYMSEFFDAKITVRGDMIHVEGEVLEVKTLTSLIYDCIKRIEDIGVVSKEYIDSAIDLIKSGDFSPSALRDDILLLYRGRAIRPKTSGQKYYVDSVRKNSITFAIGPAGTGKTYLAMAMAMAALKEKEVKRIILTRPVVEAGESLGFLPGTLQEKVDPYVRPLYDALFDMTDSEKANRLIEQGVIEIAPLAFMRGRTLNDSFVILDEAQNTTPEQMKMFLTRLGFGSKMVITGDVTQIDLPGATSGLKTVRNIVGDIKDIEFCILSDKDVARHSLVQQIVKAYEKQ